MTCPNPRSCHPAARSGRHLVRRPVPPRPAVPRRCQDLRWNVKMWIVS